MNIFWLATGKGIRFVLGITVGVLVARYLGPKRFGVYSYALSFVAMFLPLANLGVKSVVIRELVRRPEDREAILGTNFLMMFCSGFLGFLAALVSIYWIRSGDWVTIVLVGTISITFLINALLTISYYFESEVQSKFNVIATTVGFLVGSGIKIGLLYFQQPLIYFGIASLAELGIAGLGYLLLYQNNGNSVFKWKFDPKIAKSILRDAYPLLISSVMIAIYLRVDQILIRELIDDQEAGIYAVAVRLNEIFQMISIIIVSSVYPSIIKAKEAGEEVFFNRLYRLFSVMVILSLIMIVTFTFGGKFIITLLFGQAYIESAGILKILIWSGLFMGLATARTPYLMSLNWTKVYMVIAIGTCVVNIIANYILIPIYGGYGAAIASLISHAFAGYFSCFLYKPLHKIGRLMTKAIFMPRPL